MVIFLWNSIMLLYHIITWSIMVIARHRDDSRCATSQWEMALLYNDVSHWLGASAEWTLRTYKFSVCKTNVSLCKMKFLLEIQWAVSTKYVRLPGMSDVCLILTMQFYNELHSIVRQMSDVSLPHFAYTEWGAVMTRFNMLWYSVLFYSDWCRT